MVVIFINRALPVHICYFGDPVNQFTDTEATGFCGGSDTVFGGVTKAVRMNLNTQNDPHSH